MKKNFLIAILAISTVFLSGCGTQQKATKEIQQEATVTKEGILQTKSSEDYLLSTGDGIVNITSTKVNLDNYLKKKIKVTGMFSGSTLYVDEIEIGN